MAVSKSKMQESMAMEWFDCGLTFTHFYLLTSNLLPNFIIAVTHSIFNIMSSVISLNQIDGSEL